EELERIQVDLEGIEGPIKESLAEEKERIQNKRLENMNEEKALSDEREAITGKARSRHSSEARELRERQATERQSVEKNCINLQEEIARLEERKNAPSIDPELERQLTLAEEHYESAR